MVTRMRHMNGFGGGIRRAGAVALAIALSGTAGAQAPASTAPWRAWLGCWSAGPSTPLGVDGSQPFVCVSPTGSTDAVTVTTIADGKVVSTQRVDASGRDVPLEAKGCSGTQVGRWSADGRRVYLTASATCDGVTRTTTGILAMSPAGEWLDVQGIRVDGTENVRIARYRDVGVHGSVPADIAESLRDGGMAVGSARIAAGASIGTAAVVEATSAVGVPVTEAFVLERGQRFPLDARQLVSLADAGVPARITDAMIAVSNPQVFAVRRPDVADTTEDRVAGRRIYVVLDRYSPWGWGYGDIGSRYGYDPYYSDRYRYDSYGSRYYGYPGYAYYGGQVVIVKGTEPAQAHGTMVKGRGYREPPSSSASHDRATQRSAAPAGSSSGSAGSSGSGSSSSGSASSGSSERTAKPRP